MDLFTIFIGVLILFLFVAYRHFTRFKGYFESLGIPKDLSSPWFKQNFTYHEHDLKCLKKFGPVWGRFDGVNPVIMIADPQLVKEILVKKFDKFPNHVPFGVEDQHLTVFDAHDEKWRALRKSLSPIFTTGKIKGMMLHIGNVVDNMVEALREKSKESPDNIFDIKSIFQGLSLDTIANCAFGIETNSFKDPNNVLYQRCLLAFSDLRVKNHVENLIVHLIEYFPVLRNYMDLYGKENYSYLRKITKDIVDSRKEPRTGDFIDRLKEMLADLTPNSVVSEEIVLAQGIIFFIAGFETSSNTLSSLSYNLAKNPDVQEKIFEEIKAVVDEFDGRVDYETINQMPYLEAAINENLRMYPPGIRLDRYCNEDCQVGEYSIKKDTTICFPIYAMHHNSKYFPEPEKFRPERFLKKEEDTVSSYSFIPFGGGPRQCIGMRFAMIEVKLAMAKLLQNFRIVDTPKTELKIMPGDSFLLSYPNINVKIEERSK